MTPINIQTLYDVTDVTWPSAATTTENGWIIKDGAEGGKRVSAAVQVDPAADIAHAENAMLSLNQSCLFQIRTDEEALDAALDKRGYELIDRVVLLFAPLSTLAKTHSDQNLTAPTAAMKQVWADGGIGIARLNVMARANGPKTYSHINGNAVGYAAIHNGTCMVHAVEVSQNHRRQGLGKSIMHQIAGWAETHGAKNMAVITVIENTAARTLYQNLGMSEVGHYHYRIKR